MIVQWVGGPEDGREFAMADGSRRVAVTLPLTVRELMTPADPTADVEVARLDVPIRRTPNGWRAYWNEGRR